MPDTTAVKLGVAFDLNGKAVVLQPKEAISAIQKKGIELTLPERLDLGSAGSAVDSILAKLGSSYRAVKPSAPLSSVTYIKDKIPDFSALTTAYNKVTDAQLHVDKFHAKIPGSETKKADGTTPETEIKYTIGLSATWELKGDETGLTLTGIYFEVSNEPTAIAAETTAAAV